MRVHHAFRLAGGPRSVENLGDIVRMRTGQAREPAGFRGVQAAVAEQTFRRSRRRSIEHDHLAQVSKLRTQAGNHFGVVETAKGRRNEQDFKFGLRQHEAQFAAAIDREQRIADRPQPGAGHVESDELPSVGELERDDVAAADTHRGKPQCRPGGGALDLGEALADRRSGGGIIGDNRRLVCVPGDCTVKVVRDQPVRPQACSLRRFDAVFRKQLSYRHRIRSWSVATRLLGGPAHRASSPRAATAFPHCIIFTASDQRRQDCPFPPEPAKNGL